MQYNDGQQCLQEQFPQEVLVVDAGGVVQEIQHVAVESVAVGADPAGQEVTDSDSLGNVMGSDSEDWSPHLCVPSSDGPMSPTYGSDEAYEDELLDENMRFL